jgi:uncharacterized protein (TIGR03085 family)
MPRKGRVAQGAARASMSTIVRVTRLATDERTALADLLESLGPERPTLCTGWTTRDLAAHLVVRASRPDAAAGIVFRPLAPHTKRVQDRAAGRDWAELVARVRRRPWWGDALNTVEYYVHHEDVRRAQPGWEPRELSAEMTRALWNRVRQQAKFVLRRTPAVVTVNSPGYGTVVGGRGGDASVELTGHPQELMLFLIGRQDHALVELTGPLQITERMRHARYGI